jgi:hypothetical protein
MFYPSHIVGEHELWAPYLAVFRKLWFFAILRARQLISGIDRCPSNHGTRTYHRRVRTPILLVQWAWFVPKPHIQRSSADFEADIRNPTRRTWECHITSYQVCQILPLNCYSSCWERRASEPFQLSRQLQTRFPLSDISKIYSTNSAEQSIWHPEKEFEAWTVWDVVKATAYMGRQ